MLTAFVQQDTWIQRPLKCHSDYSKGIGSFKSLYSQRCALYSTVHDRTESLGVQFPFLIKQSELNVPSKTTTTEICVPSCASLRDEPINISADEKNRFSKKFKMKPKERPIHAKRKGDFPVDRATVFKLALEDAETSHFILTYFSHPEQRPNIISRRKIILQDRKYIWIVEFIEKIPFCFNGKKDMMNIARIEVDPFCGKIVGRQYFKSLFEEEYRRIVKQTKVI